MAPRTLPHNLDAEAAVLGAILLHNETLASLAELSAESFYDPKNGAVFAAMRALDEQGRPIDEITLDDQLQRAGRLEAVGGLPYLSWLAQKVPTADNVEHYAAIVREKHGVRTLMTALSDGLAMGYADHDTLAVYQAEVLARVSNAMDRGTITGPRSAALVARDLGRHLQKRQAAPSGITGVPTGFAALDERLAGLQPTDLVILAARPSMGKSALAGCIARNAAGRGHPVLAFSLEMSDLQLMERLLCAEASVSSTALRTGRLQRQQLAALADGLPRLAMLPLEIDETAGLSHHDLRARARRFATAQASDRPGLVIVDYLQLLQSTHRYESREREIAEASCGLKALAKSLGWPVLALSQLNRNLEARANKRPLLSDLRESGAIEQDADQVLFLYRDVVYNEQTDEPDKAELIIAKHRHGSIGAIELRFEGEYTRFTDAHQPEGNGDR